MKAPPEPKAWLLERLALELAAHDPLLPPWLRFPDIPRGSVNWNMGARDVYVSVWQLWMSRKSTDEAIEYYREFAPIPNEWVDWVAFRLYEDYDGARDQIYARRLADVGLVELDDWFAWHHRILDELTDDAND